MSKDISETAAKTWSESLMGTTMTIEELLLSLGLLGLVSVDDIYDAVSEFVTTCTGCNIWRTHEDLRCPNTDEPVCPVCREYERNETKEREIPIFRVKEQVSVRQHLIETEGIRICPQVVITDHVYPGDQKAVRARCTCGWDGSVVIGSDNLAAHEGRQHLMEHLKELNG